MVGKFIALDAFAKMERLTLEARSATEALAVADAQGAKAQAIIEGYELSLIHI